MDFLDYNKTKLAKFKKDNLFLARIAHFSGLNKVSLKLTRCNTYMRAIADKTNKHYLVYGSNHCHLPYCPICQYLKSRIRELEIYQSLMYDLKKHYKTGTPKYKVYFFTVTIPNVDDTRYAVSGGEKLLHKYVGNLEKEIRGWNTKTRHYKGLCRGMIVKYEHTVSKSYTINLHAHLILLVPISCGTGRYYHQSATNVKFWQKLWWKACDGHHFICKIERAYYKNKDNKKVYLNKRNLAKVIPHVAKEVGKYEGKSSDFIKAGKKVIHHHYHLTKYSPICRAFKSIALGLKGTQSLQYMGMLAVAHRMVKRQGLNVVDVDDGKTIRFVNKDTAKYQYHHHKYHMASKPITSVNFAVKLIYEWRKRGYNLDFPLIDNLNTGFKQLMINLANFTLYNHPTPKVLKNYGFCHHYTDFVDAVYHLEKTDLYKSYGSRLMKQTFSKDDKAKEEMDTLKQTYMLFFSLRYSHNHKQYKVMSVNNIAAKKLHGLYPKYEITQKNIKLNDKLEEDLFKYGASHF